MTTKQKFKIGQLVATPAAQAVLEKNNVSWLAIVQRHVNSEQGTLCDEDHQANLDSADNYRLSSYEVGGEKVWVITEHDGSVTTILLPEEY